MISRSEVVAGVWAKTRRDGSSAFHPLQAHLLDVGAMAEALWQQVLSTESRKRTARGLEVDEDDAGRWVALLAAAHDLGKATPGFQGRAPERIPDLRRRGLDVGEATSVPAHGLLSTVLLADLLEDSFSSSRLVSTILARLVGGHHGTVPSAAELRRATSTRVRGDGPWREVQNALWSALLEAWRPTVAPGAVSDGAALRLAGLVSVADWVASDPAFFPFAMPTGRPVPLAMPKYLSDARARARVALDRIGWRAPAAAGIETNFSALFDLSPRPTQQLLAGLPPRDGALYVIEDGTGSGKTEAAFHLIARSLRTGSCRGAYVALPTRATSDQAFRRLRGFLDRAVKTVETDLQLVHGSAALSVDHEELEGATGAPNPEAVYDDEDGREPTGVRAASWFRQRKRGLLGPFAVGTVDQALLSVLQARHHFVRTWGLSDKIVVLDEVHAYDTYMSQLIERLLEWLAATGATVILLSATLPAERRRRLIDAFRRGRGVPDALAEIEAVPYPRITVADHAHLNVHTSEPVRRRTVSIEHVRVPAQDQERAIAAYVADQLDGAEGCLAVICNTVASAQRAFASIRKALDETTRVVLLTSRMRFQERSQLEQQLNDQFGPPDRAVERPERAVVVATQVIEQSLDLDFDLVISELAPIDLLIQRAGRLHRHHGRKRPRRFAEPRLAVLRGPDRGDGTPFLDRGSIAVYGEHLLLRTSAVFAGYASLREPDDLDPLVEAVYGDGLLEVSSAMQARLDQAAVEAERVRECHEQQARAGALPAPDRPDSIALRGTLGLLDDEDAENHPTVRALTRLDDRPSVEVVLALRKECLVERASSSPTADNARALLRLAVRLPGYRVVEALGPEHTPTAWRKNPLLRQVRLVALDSKGGATIGPVRLRLDPELGVVIDPT